MKTALIAPLVIMVLTGLSLTGPGHTTEDLGAGPVLRESLRQVELAFAASVKNRDPKAFAGFIADEAVFVGASVQRGREAIVAAWQVFFAPDGPVLEWWPEIVEIGDGRDIGLTRGPYKLTYVDQAGKQQVTEGVFNSVWRLQDDGTWRVVFDAGCE